MGYCEVYRMMIMGYYNSDHIGLILEYYGIVLSILIDYNCNNSKLHNT